MQEIPCEHRFMLNWQRETVKIKYFDYVHDGILCQFLLGFITATYNTQGSSKRLSYTNLRINCITRSVKTDGNYERFTK